MFSYIHGAAFPIASGGGGEGVILRQRENFMHLLDTNDGILSKFNGGYRFGKLTDNSFDV